MTAILGKSEGRNIVIDVPTLVETRLMAQANSGAGKSWLLRRLLEQTAGIVQHLVLDTEGEFVTLSEKHDYVVAAPGNPQAVATPRTAAKLARELLRLRVSAVVDISDLERHDRVAFIRLFIESMMTAPPALQHPVLVVLDEAHLYVPEKGRAESSAAVTDLVTRGRKKGFCAVLATQRLAMLSKDVTTQMNNKLVGRCVEIDAKRAAEELGMPANQINTLRTLAPGMFYAFGPALSPDVVLMRVGDVATTHPRAGERHLVAPPPPSAKMLAVLAELADLPEEAAKEARTLEEFRVENALIKRELAQAKRAQPHPPAPVETIKTVQVPVPFIAPQIQSLVHSVHKSASALVNAMMETEKENKNAQNRSALEAARQHKALGRPLVEPTAAATGNSSGVASELSEYDRTILGELVARHPSDLTRAQISALTGYSIKSSSFSGALSRLKGAAAIENVGKRFRATPTGLEILGADAPQAPTTHQEAMNKWGRALSLASYKMLQAIVNRGSEGLDREGVAMDTGYSLTSSSFSGGLSDLLRYGLVSKQHGIYVPCDMLYPEGQA